VKGKEQGYLPPDDILQRFPEVDAEPDQIFRIFAAFKEIGIEVTDGEKDFEEVEQIDDEMLLDIEMMDSVSLDDPVRMYLKEIGRVSLLTANDEVELAQAIEAKPLHDAMKALNVIEEVDGRQRSVDELLPEVIERLATVKRKGQQSHIAQELLGLIDLGKLPNLTDAAAAERRRIANGARPRVRAAALESYRIAGSRMTEPYDDEIGEEMGITPEKVREIVKVSQDPVSLETPIGEEEDSHLGDFVEDREAVSPSDAASLTMLHSEVEDVLDTLTPRERRVLQLRFGLIDGHQRTLEEVEAEDEDPGSLLARLLVALGSASSEPLIPPEATAWSPPNAAPAFDTRNAVLQITQHVIEEAARTGNVVIVGRGGAYILRSFPDALHVFLRAAEAVRVKTIMARFNIGSEDEARRRLKQTDENWTSYIRQVYGHDRNHPAHY